MVIYFIVKIAIFICLVYFLALNDQPRPVFDSCYQTQDAFLKPLSITLLKKQGEV